MMYVKQAATRLARDIDQINGLVNNLEASYAKQVGQRILAKPVETRRDRIRAIVLGVLYNVIAAVLSYAVSATLVGLIVAIRVLFPLTAAAVLFVCNGAIIVLGLQWVFTDSIHNGKLDVFNVLWHICATVLIASLSIGSSIVAAIKYQKTFMY